MHSKGRGPRWLCPIVSPLLTPFSAPNTAPSAIGYGTKIATNAFKADGGFSAKGGGLKDAQHIKNLGQSAGCPMHIVEKAIEHLEASIAANTSGQDKDWSSLVAGQRIESGMKPFGD